MNIVHKIKLLFRVSFICEAIASATILWMPFIRESRIWQIFTGIMFWLFLICGYICIGIANHLRKKSNLKLCRIRSHEKQRIGLLGFFLNTPARISDSVLIVTVIMIVITNFTKLKETYLPYPLLSLLLLLLNAHCMFNGKVYIAINSKKKKGETKNMTKAKTNLSERLIATLLSVFMVFSMLPFSTITAIAATDEHPDAVTITVKDENGSPVKDADVTFTLDSILNGDEWKHETKQTDEYGCVEVMSKSDFVANDLTITATVSKEDFETNETITDVPITSDAQNLEVVLTSTTIDDVKIEGKTLTYNGAAQEIVSVTEVAGDTVDYGTLPVGVTLNEQGKPVATNAGTYSLTVTVKRDGKTDLIKTVTTTINKAKLSVSLEAKTVSYNETEQELVTVDGLQIGDKILWSVDGIPVTADFVEITDISNIGIPTAMAVNENPGYKVNLQVKRGDNYEVFNDSVTVKMLRGELNLEGLTVQGLDSVYKVDENGNPVAQNTVIVTPESGHPYTLMYQLDDGDLTIDENDWVDEIPTVTQAGSYIVWVKAVKDGYNESDVPVNPAAGAVAPYNVYIAKADQSLEFVNKVPTEVTVDETAPENNVYDFSVVGKNLSGKDVQYSLVNASSNGVASISDDGKLTVAKAGIVTVKATREGNENYNAVDIYSTITVKVSSNGLISFEKDTVDYVLDEIGTVSTETAIKKNEDDNGELTYSIDKTNIGLSIDSKTGEVVISDRNMLAKAMGHSGNAVVTVTVEKAAGTVTEWQCWPPEYITKEVYPSASASYTILITYAATPEFNAVCQITEPATTGWYNAENPAVVSSIDTTKYSIALDTPESFSDSQIISTQGIEEHYIYVKDKTTKHISAGIEINIKIDNENPYDLKVEYAKSPMDEFLEDITLGFYNPSVTLKFTATDDTAGLDYLEWTYIREEGQSETNLETENGTLTFTDGKAELTLTGSQAKQYRGNISFTVYDKAGNSTSATDDGNIFVVDTISPTMTVKYAGTDSYSAAQNSLGDVHYFNGDVEVELAVTEANFYAEDVKVSVSKDGGEFSIVTADWSSNSVDDHTGTFTLLGDGDYVVKVEYTDKSNNAMTVYQSETITIDTTAPQVEIAFSHNGDEQKTTFTVKEHNFRPDDVMVTGTIKDITGSDIPYTAAQLTDYLRNGEWSEIAPDMYQIEYDGYMNGIYNLAMDYKDLANWSAETFVADVFVIDHDAPTDVKIEYSESVLDTVLETVTLGFYNPDVTVTFTAYDTSSGVDSFKWGYTKQDGQSDSNRPTDDESQIDTQVVTAVQDSADKSKYTAQVTLTATEAEQLRGYMSVIATDTYSNSSDKVTDEGYVLVVDTISPKISVEYSKESRVVGTTAYYNGDAVVTFIVNEANFFSEDVVVSVSKDGGTPYAVTPNWIDKSVDEHIGTYTLSGDGDYVVNVEYTDRSNNQMDSYTSHTITIDTIKPVIDVEYQNTNLIDTVKDWYEKDRKYFDDTQTAIVTINEHNFDADEVDFQIVATDITGKELDVSELNTKTQWSVGETNDIHIITITYPGDANYTFDVDYTDLATNKADDYIPDYFTVDKTAPTNLKVSYSTSVLDTVLETLSFGFYNAKMTVTLTADDITSGVHNFKYSYLNAAGVSSVNAELIDQAIEAADIVYLEDGLTATMTFEIPKMVLGNDNQFNGTVEFTAYDRADNETYQKDSKRIIVDNIAPTATVQYNAPVNEVNGISYYDGDINATVTITEANFYADDVQIMVAKDNGIPYAVPASWTDNSVDTHTGTFTLTEDGDYIITINYQDKSTNQMQTYTSNQLTIDTDIQAPTYSINGVAKTEEGGAYKNDATIAFSFEDENFDTKTIKLVRTRFNSVEDVTDEFITSADTEKGGSGSFEIPSEIENDGIYILTIGMTDKANHITESSLKFTINRYGSVYEYSDYLISLLEKQYIKIDGNNSEAISQDLVITEYNANQILTDSLNILITCDGEAIDTQYTTAPTIDSNVGVGESGWYQYTYTIAKENFAKDGVYKITLTSAYAADDSDRNDSTSVPENSIDSSGNQILHTMDFTVDTTKPEIRNIVNLDKPIVNAQTLEVDYTIIDVGGLQSIEVIVNGSAIDTITELGDSTFNYSGSFTLNESTNAQTIQFKVMDMAGNVTDTASDDFSTNDLYVFNDTITVSTNFFVRWYANKPLFWGSIGGVVVLAGAICYLVAYKRRKKENEEVK